MTQQRQDQHYAGEKPDDVRQVGDAAPGGEPGPLHVGVLQQEPRAEHQPRRQRHRDEEQERQQAHHPGSGIEEEVRAQYPGNRAGRADQRGGGLRGVAGVAVRRDVATNEVEAQVAQPAQPVFDVVAEDDRKSMLPSRCSHPPCRNIENNTDRAGDFSKFGRTARHTGWPAASVLAGPYVVGSCSSLISSLGIAAYRWKNACCWHTCSVLLPPESPALATGVSRNTTTLMAISA